MRTGAVTLLAAFCCLGAAAQQPPGFDPVQFGMSYDAVRAAAPGAWSEMKFGGILGRAVVSFAGETFDLEYELEPWDNARIHAHLADDSPDHAACERRFLALGAALESRYGTFSRLPDTPSRDQMFETRQETLRFGKSSRARIARRVDDIRPRAQWDFELGATAGRSPYSIGIHASAYPRKAPLDASSGPVTCELRVLLVYSQPRPPVSTLPFADLAITPPPAGVLHHSIESLALPPEGVEARFDCGIMSGGRLIGCVPTARTATLDPDLLVAANARLSAMKIADRTRDGTRWTPDERTQAVILLSPRDRIAIELPEAPATGPLMIERSPAEAAIREAYPQRAIRANANARVTAICVVQADMSIVCPQLDVDSAELEAEFRRAAALVLMQYRIAPIRQDGASSAGTTFRTAIRFRLDP
jgi:hypothetical protein